MKLQRGQNLFEALYNICDFLPTVDHMDIIVEAVEKDNEEYLSTEEAVAKYWHERCKKAEAYINECPFDLDMSGSKYKAWQEYYDFIND